MHKQCGITARTMDKQDFDYTAPVVSEFVKRCFDKLLLYLQNVFKFIRTTVMLESLFTMRHVRKQRFFTNSRQHRVSNSYTNDNFVGELFLETIPLIICIYLFLAVVTF